MTQDVKNHLDIDTGVFHVTIIAPVTVYHHQSHNKADLIIGNINNNLKVSAASTPGTSLRTITHEFSLTPHAVVPCRWACGTTMVSGATSSTYSSTAARSANHLPHPPPAPTWLMPHRAFHARRHVSIQELILTGFSAPLDGRKYNDLKGSAAFMIYRTEVPTLLTVIAPHPALPPTSASQHL